MNSIIGALRVVLGADTAAFEEGMSAAEKKLSGFSRSMAKLGGKLESIGGQLSLRVTAPIAAIGTASYAAAQQSAEAFGQVEAALKSMGGASGKTTEELQKSAKELQHISTFDDDDILRKVTANMLTFGNISGQAFDRAQLAAVNLSARLGQDLQSSAIQVGKALNDPIKGVTALQRVGVSFTEAQRAQIKAMVEAGNAAGAQKIILGELEKQFGGSAQALRNATPSAALTEAWNDLTETLGGLMIKVLPPLTQALASVLNWFTNLSPATQQWLVIIAGMAAAIGPVIAAIGAVVTTVGALTSAITVAMPVLTALGAFFLTNPIGLALTAIAAAAGAVYLAWKNWDKITAFVKGLYEGVKTWLMDKLKAVFDWVIGKVKAVSDAFFKLYDKVVGHSYVPDLIDGIAEEFARLDHVMVSPAQAAADAVAGAFDGIESPEMSAPDLKGTFRDTFKDGVKAALHGDLGSFFENFFSRAAGNALDRALDSIAGVLFPSNGGGGGILDTVLGSLGGSLPGFQTGGSFQVGGAGSKDSRVVAFRASPGEMVNVSKGQQGGQVVQNFDLRGAIVQEDLYRHITREAEGAAQRGAQQGAKIALAAQPARASAYQQLGT